MQTARGIGVWVAFLVVATVAWGQNKGWDRRFGGSMDESCNAVVAAPVEDGGFLLFGNSASGPDGDHTESLRGGRDFWCVKMSPHGDKIWDKRFGGSAHDFGIDADTTRDGGFILGGTSESGADGDKTQGSRGGLDNWIVKIDSSGNKQWDRRFGGTSHEELAAVQQTRDGGYFIACNSSSGAGGDRTQTSRGDVDYWVVKTDASGNKQWDKRFGTSGMDFCTDAMQTRDGGYILGGNTDHGAGGDKTQSSRGGQDYWIVKIDSTGRKQWDRRFGGSGDDSLWCVLQTLDGGYILGGASDSGAGGDKTAASQGDEDMWIVKVSASGAKQWDASFGGSGEDELGQILQNPDGSYLIVGDSDSPVSGDVTQASRGGQDFWVVKVNAAGTKQWVRRFGGSDNDTCNAACRTVEGSYLLAGSSRSGLGFDKTEDSRGEKDYWAVKMMAPDAFEADNDLYASKTIRNGAVQNRNIHRAGNEDWAKFTVGPGGARNIQIMSTFDTQLWLMRDSVAVGYDEADYVGGPSIIELATLDPGTYHIFVREYNNDEILPYYQLSARWTQVVPRDAYEPDNSLGGARLIRNGRTQNRTIHRAGNRDWAKFSIGGRGAQNVRVETRGTSGDTQLWIYNAAGQRLYFDDDSGPGRFSRIQLASLGPGTYYIRVQEKGNNGRIAAYLLRVNWTAR